MHILSSLESTRYRLSCSSRFIERQVIGARITERLMLIAGSGGSCTADKKEYEFDGNILCQTCGFLGLASDITPMPPREVSCLNCTHVGTARESVSSWTQGMIERKILRSACTWYACYVRINRQSVSKNKTRKGTSSNTTPGCRWSRN